MAISAWLVFLIVREHTSWRPAAWIAAGLFLSLIDIHRFHGGFPRAFVHPVRTAHRAARDATARAERRAGGRGRSVAVPAGGAAGGRRADRVVDPGGRSAAARGRAARGVRPARARRRDRRRARIADRLRWLSARDDRSRGTDVPGVRCARSAALLRAFDDRLPEAEPERIRPSHLREHPRSRRAGAARHPASRSPAPARGGRGAAGRRAGRLGARLRPSSSSSTCRTATRIRFSRSSRSWSA